MKYLEGVIHSVIKRRKQILKIPLVIFVAAVFITIIAIGGESLNSYQKVINKKAFGQWFILENSINRRQSKELSEHPYLVSSGKIMNIFVCYTEDYEETSCLLGYIDNEACDIASLSLYEGHMPKNNQEIAIEKNTLVKLGYELDLGQSISVYYYDRSAGQKVKDAEQCSKEYKLVGILDNYASYWDGKEYIPTMLITENEAESYGYVQSQTVLYTLDEKIKTTDYKQVYQGMKAQVETATVYNSKVYDYKGVRFDQNAAYAQLFITVIGLLMGFGTLLMYHKERAESYRMYSRMGLEIHQLLKGSVIEGALLILPAAAAGVIIGTGIVSIILKILLFSQKADMFLVEDDSLLKAAEIAGIFSILLILAGMLLTFFMIKPQGRRWKKRFPRKGRNRIKQVILSYIIHGMRREGAAWILRCGFSIGTVIIITLCLKGITDAKQAYNHADRKPDLMITSNGLYNDSGEDRMYISAGQVGEEDISIYAPYKSGRLSLSDYLSADIVQNIQEMKGVEKVTKAFIENNQLTYDFWLAKGEEYTNFMNEHGIEEFEKLTGVKSKEQFVNPHIEGEKVYFEYRTVYSLMLYNGTVQTYYFVKPQRAVYEELAQYIDPQYLDYEAFENGDQLILFVDADVTGIYNAAYHSGDIKKYRYDFISSNLYAADSSIEEAAKQFTQEVTIAGVVCLDEETKKELYEKFPLLENLPAKNTILMSESFVDKMNHIEAQVLCEMLGKEYCPEEYNDLSGNVLCVNYGLDSLYRATDNFLQVYLQTEGLSYISNAEENNVYRINYIHKILSYIITMIGLALIYILAVMIWCYFKLQGEKERLKLYAAFGVQSKQLAGSGALRYILETAAGIPAGIILCMLLGTGLGYCGVYLLVDLALMLFCTLITALLYMRAVFRRNRK